MTRRRRKRRRRRRARGDKVTYKLVYYTQILWRLKSFNPTTLSIDFRVAYCILSKHIELELLL